MSNDCRISTGLPDHPKTKKLIRRLGDGAAWRLVRLFLWAAQNRSDGDLSGMSTEDLELAVDWVGDDGAFIAALIDVGFLDGQDGAFKIHDWAVHNPWAASAGERSEASKWAALCKRYGRDGAAQRMPDYAARMRPAHESQTDSTPAACDPDAPLPIPTPIPTPIPKQDLLASADADAPPDNVTPIKPPTPDCPHQEIVDLYHEILPTLQQVRVMTEARQKQLRARWRENPKHQNIEFWRNYFEHVSRSDFLMGRSQQANGRHWVADFDFLTTQSKFVSVIEGKYHHD